LGGDPRGETLQAGPHPRRRCAARVIRNHPDDTIVLVAHDSVNRVLLLHALELPLSRYWRFKQNPAASTSSISAPTASTILGSTKRPFAAGQVIGLK